MMPTRTAASNLLNTEKAIHAFRSIGNKSEPAHDGVQLSIGKILQLPANSQLQLLTNAAPAAIGRNGQSPAANADATRRNL